MSDLLFEGILVTIRALAKTGGPTLANPFFQLISGRRTNSRTSIKFPVCKPKLLFIINQGEVIPLHRNYLFTPRCRDLRQKQPRNTLNSP